MLLLFGAGFFNGMYLGVLCGFIMPLMWWIIFVLGALVDYSSSLYRSNLPRLLLMLPLSLQRCFHTPQAARRMHMQLE